jgi:hypothetical protein
MAERVEMKREDLEDVRDMLASEGEAAWPLSEYLAERGLSTGEADLCRRRLSEVQGDLAALKERYGLASDEFHRRYQAGQMDDRMDHVEWASLVQMRDNLRERLRTLSGEVQLAS